VFTGATARRTTGSGGGGTEFAVPPCAHDALAYLFHARRELAAGRLPAPERHLLRRGLRHPPHAHRRRAGEGGRGAHGHGTPSGGGSGAAVALGV
jgi:hypothetical protein